ncbi:MAG: hypothetical protein Q4D14_02130 [Bacteroidales bacterium]|nr:hypothetical protein [Bacteroidales bacterium]
MRKLKITFRIVFILLSLCLTTNAKIWYVSQGGRGNYDGTSWDNASPDIKNLIPSFTAIDTIDSCNNPLTTIFYIDSYHPQSNKLCQPFDTIFVSRGTYSPLYMWNGNGCGGLFCQGTSFPYNLYGNYYHNQISIFGGFKGDEPSLSDRILGLYPSVIDSGDTAKCVWIEGRSFVVMDGFTLTNGAGEGSAIRAVDCSSLFSNLIITKNNNDTCTLYFENVGKNRGNHGYDFAIDTTLPFQLTNTLIYNNNKPGTLIKADSSVVCFLNNTIADNDDGGIGGKFTELNYSSILEFKNTILWNNYSNRISYRDANSYVSLFHSGIDNRLPYIVDNGHNFVGDPYFVNSTDYHVTIKSYAVNNGNLQEYMHFAPAITAVLPYYDLVNADRTNSNKYIDIGAYQNACNTISCYPGVPLTPNYNTNSSFSMQENVSKDSVVEINDVDLQSVLVDVYSPTGIRVATMSYADYQSNQTTLNNGVYIVKFHAVNQPINTTKIIIINGKIYE